MDASAAYLVSRQKQGEAYVALLESRLRITKKYAELIDLPHLLAEEQRQREHAHSLAAMSRLAETLSAANELQLALARHDVDLAKTHEQGVRAQRNLEAAQRVKDAEIDKWYAEAQARKNNAEAERQDTVADLGGGQPNGDAASAASAAQRAQDLALIDHQIELERQRGNEPAVLALINLRALLRGT